MKIFKYPLLLVSDQFIEVPANLSALSLQVQNDTICLWAAIDPNAPLISQRIFIVGTGQNVPPNVRAFLGTLQIDNYVWHVFAGEAIPSLLKNSQVN